MTRMPNGGKGHAVHIDNLFTSSKLLSTLRDYGIGAAGTVRTSRTKREENKEIREKQELESYDLLQDQDLSEDLDPPNLQLALDLIHEIKENLDQKFILEIYF